jgi:hypothetical protein
MQSSRRVSTVLLLLTEVNVFLIGYDVVTGFNVGDEKSDMTMIVTLTLKENRRLAGD